MSFIQKKYYKGCFGLVLAILGFANPCMASSYFFRNYNEQMHLEYATVCAVSQDKSGFVWFSTPTNVYRFDGKHAVSLKEISCTKENIDFYYAWIFIDSANRLFLPSGLIYDINKNSFEKRDLNIIPNKGIFEDAYKQIWLTYHSGKLIRENVLTSKRDSIETEPMEAVAASKHFCWSVQKTIFYKTSLKGSLKLKATKPFTISGKVTNMIMINDFEALVSTDALKLYRVNLTTRVVELLNNHLYVRSIEKQDHQRFWIGTETGIYIYHSEKREMEHLVKDALMPNALKDNVCYALFKDNDGGMWIGHYFKGLSYQPKRLCEFNAFKSIKTDLNFKGDVVREFCRDNNNHLWIGTEDGGVNRYDLTTGTFLNFSLNNSTHRIHTTNVHGLAVIGNELWIGSFDSGIGVLDIPSGRLVRTYRKEEPRSGLRTNYVFSFLKTSRYGLLAATEQGVQHYNPQTDCFETFTFVPSYELVTQLMIDRRGRLWMIGGPLVRCLYPDGRLTLLTSSQAVNSIMEDRQGRVWIVCNNEIACYDENHNRFVAPKKFSAVCSGTLFRLIEDERSNFWISSNNGLLLYNLRTQFTHLFTTFEGLPNTTFNYGSSFTDKDGTCYFGTYDGFVAFQPGTLTLKSSVPKLGFSCFSVINADSTRSVYTHMPDEKLELSAHDNTINVEFVSLNYSTAENLRFAYRLEGLDRDWHMQQGRNTLCYTELPPGNYRLWVKSTDALGCWVDNSISYAFVIHPPFYASIWAYLIYALILIYLLRYAIHRLRKRIRQREERQMELFKMETEKNLYHTKINFFTTIAHEIRTPLSLIKAPLENVLTEARTIDDQDHLKLIQKNVDRLDDLCNQLLEFRKVESNELLLNFVVTDVGALMTDILFCFTAAMQDKGLTCVHNLSEVHLKIPVDREVLTKIISNLFNNAIKYAHSNIIISLQQEATDFILSVENDGFSISTEEREHVFNLFYRTDAALTQTGTGIGLTYSRSLAEMHNGALVLAKSEEGVTRFELRLPLKQKASFTEEYIDDIEDITIEEGKHLDGAKNILVVEDERMLRCFLSQSLGKYYHILTANNGQQAVELLKTNQIDLVITDVMMPRMDGCELCREIKATIEWSDIPVIMLTAKNRVENRLEGLAAGADEYIDKPFSLKYLCARIAYIFEKQDRILQHYRECGKPLIEISDTISLADKLFIEKFDTIVKRELSNENLSIEYLSQEMNMSQSTLYRRVKTLLDKTPTNYIQLERLTRGAELIKSGKYNRVSSVAYEVGFASASYFTMCFTKHFGCSPREYTNK